LRLDLLQWYDAERRGLPWRHDARGANRPDPYRVWLSEVMLQQTRVETVRPYYEAWLQRFPGVEALAAASEDEVTAEWSGLGYYARARNLHRAAQRVARDGWPKGRAAWRRLPGVGDYTSAAIASIVDGEAVAAVDGNVQRVVARLDAITHDVTRLDGRKAVAAAANAYVEPQRPGDWNQAMMDLGATVCTPVPRCPDCPLAIHCRALAAGTQDALPVRAARRAPTEQDVHFGMVMADGRLLLVKRPEKRLLAGTWALPGGESDTRLVDLIAQQTGLHVSVSESAARAKHAFTHRVWQMRVHQCHVLDVLPKPPAWEVQWVPLNRLEDAGLSTAMKRALGAAGLPVV
jgi:A/G-specific adenine glycosylase